MVMNVFINTIGRQRLNDFFLKLLLNFEATDVDPTTILLS